MVADHLQPLHLILVELLTGAGRHLNQGSGFIQFKRGFQVADGNFLAVAQSSSFAESLAGLSDEMVLGGAQRLKNASMVTRLLADFVHSCNPILRFAVIVSNGKNP